MVRGLWQQETNLALIQWWRWQLTRVRAKDIYLDWQWVRGHQGDPGNERADKLAKEGAGGVQRVFPALQVPDQVTPLPLKGMVRPSVRHRVKCGGPASRPDWNGIGPPWFMEAIFPNTEPLIPWYTKNGGGGAAGLGPKKCLRWGRLTPLRT